MSNTNYFNSRLPIGGENISSSIFSRIKKLGSNMNSTTLILLLFLIIFLISIIVYYFYYYKKQNTNAKYYPNSEHMTSSNGDKGEAEVLFFYADWCPHCKTAKPIWNEIKTEYQNKTINGYTILFTEINCSEETAEVEKMMNQYNVEGYPTIKLLKDGQVIEYDAKPTKETLTQFLNTVV